MRAWSIWRFSTKVSDKMFLFPRHWNHRPDNKSYPSLDWRRRRRCRWWYVRVNLAICASFQKRWTTKWSLLLGHIEKADRKTTVLNPNFAARNLPGSRWLDAILEPTAVQLYSSSHIIYFIPSLHAKHQSVHRPGHCFARYTYVYIGFRDEHKTMSHPQTGLRPANIKNYMRP